MRRLKDALIAKKLQPNTFYILTGLGRQGQDGKWIEEARLVTVAKEQEWQTDPQLFEMNRDLEFINPESKQIITGYDWSGFDTILDYSKNRTYFISQMGLKFELFDEFVSRNITDYENPKIWVITGYRFDDKKFILSEAGGSPDRYETQSELIKLYGHYEDVTFYQNLEWLNTDHRKKENQQYYVAPEDKFTFDDSANDELVEGQMYIIDESKKRSLMNPVFKVFPATLNRIDVETEAYDGGTVSISTAVFSTFDEEGEYEITLYPDEKPYFPFDSNYLNFTYATKFNLLDEISFKDDSDEEIYTIIGLRVGGNDTEYILSDENERTINMLKTYVEKMGYLV